MKIMIISILILSIFSVFAVAQDNDSSGFAPEKQYYTRDRNPVTPGQLEMLRRQGVEVYTAAELENVPAREMTQRDESSQPITHPPMYDASGGEIPGELVDELRASGYRMYTHQEMLERKRMQYLAEVEQRKRATAHATPSAYRVEMMENGLLKYTEVATGKVTYKNEKGYAVTSDGRIIRSDGKPTTAKIYQKNPGAIPTKDNKPAVTREVEKAQNAEK
jgi:hypothetical protein